MARPADVLPASLLPAAARLLAAARRPDVERITGLSEDAWELLARHFPGLPARPGPAAARARLRMRFLVGRFLSTQRHAPRLRGHGLAEGPSLYLSAHIGDLRALRYALRARGIPAAHLIDETHRERPAAAREDAVFDRIRPLDFPHVFHAGQTPRLRSALSRGSLIAAADRPAAQSFPAILLGGRIHLDPRPLRLARIAGAPVRAIFLTAPGGRLTLTVGSRLDSSRPEEAMSAFAVEFAEAARASPADLDGFTYRGYALSPGRDTLSP